MEGDREGWETPDRERVWRDRKGLWIKRVKEREGMRERKGCKRILWRHRGRKEKRL